MNDDATPATQPAGNLNVPPRRPPTAVGFDSPASQPGGARVEYVFTPARPHSRTENWIGRFVSSSLDLLHKASESISVAIGTRRRSSGS
jgi:hypothetical protein